MKDLNGSNVVITPDDWQAYLHRWGYQQSDIDEILRRAEKISTDQFNPDRKARLLTLLKGTKHEATMDDVKAALVNIFDFFGGG